MVVRVHGREQREERLWLSRANVQSSSARRLRATSPHSRARGTVSPPPSLRPLENCQHRPARFVLRTEWSGTVLPIPNVPSPLSSCTDMLTSVQLGSS